MKVNSAGRPNIVFILADDMGYGDVRYLNPGCIFPTPNLDRVGREGMIFSDAHASSAVCTPSRYSILTGRYCWRTYLKRHVLSGVASSLIEDGRMTLASMLRDNGYRTACVGKWHVGWDWAAKDGMEAEAAAGRRADLGEAYRNIDWIDYEKPIRNGPCSVGFDEFYGIAGSLDMPPFVYVHNDMPVEIPTAMGSAEEFVRGGPRMDSLRANNVLSHLTERAVEFIGRQSEERPFFLYFPLTSPHAPVAPAPEFAGKSGVNPYSDFCMEIDHRVGQVMWALADNGFDENTLIVFTTDNGACASNSQCAMLEERFGHFCSHVYRGYKSDIWDGGHRLPFLVRWPEAVASGGECARPVGLFDMFATVAELMGMEVPENAGEDSVSFLSDLKGGTSGNSGREGLVHHSVNGMFAIRSGRWKLCRCPGSGGRGIGDVTDDAAREKGMPEIQLYDMQADPAERKNLCGEYPQIVASLTRLLHRYVVSGRSTPGGTRENSGAVTIDDWEQVNWLPEIPSQYVLDD